MAIIPSSPEKTQGQEWVVLVRATHPHSYGDILNWFEKHICVVGSRKVKDPINKGKTAIVFRVLSKPDGRRLRNHIENHWCNN
ncbi:MAG: hypothetical protein ACOZAO_00760 [Patescibacteria group bacterium]